jgi:hypothetical protein
MRGLADYADSLRTGTWDEELLTRLNGRAVVGKPGYSGYRWGELPGQHGAFWSIATRYESEAPFQTEEIAFEINEGEMR